MTSSSATMLPTLTNWWPGGGGGGETPDLRPGLTEADITPGILGFLFTALMVGLAILVVRDMAKRMRRMKYHNQMEAEAAGDEAEFPGEIIPAGISESQQHARAAAAEARFGATAEAADAEGEDAGESRP
ncbi:MAG: hypothetical protein ACTMHH_05050 [Nesterenkonia sp.]